MLRLLFWNLHQNVRACDLLLLAAREHDLDVIVMAESPWAAEGMADALTERTGRSYRPYAGLQNGRVSIIARRPVRCAPFTFESPYLYLRELVVPHQPRLLLGAFHNVSLRDAVLETVQEEAAIAAQHVRTAEQRLGHARTLIIGDFNLMPFDLAMVKPTGFCAVMDRRDAQVAHRTVKFNDYPLFYNPMWGMMGDLGNHPPGTYYYYRSGHVNYYWHTYDQVLLRPALIPAFSPDNLRILRTIGEYQLTDDSGRPRADFASDHLPLLLRLNQGAAPWPRQLRTYSPKASQPRKKARP